VKTLLLTIALSFSFFAPSWAAPVSGQGTWEATLQARNLNGNNTADAYYDTVLNITWLANANASAGSAFDTGNDGLLLLNDARTWASQLVVGNVRGWRLPEVPFYLYGSSLGCSSCTNELTTLYHDTLGNLYANQSGGGLTNTGPFVNLASGAGFYWVDTPEHLSWYAWQTSMDGFGEGGALSGYGPLRAWAVHDGDVGVAIAAIPEPETYVLLLAGLSFMVGVAHRRKTLFSLRNRRIV